MRRATLVLLALSLLACPPKQSVEPEGEKIADEHPASKGPRGHEVRSVKLPKSMVIGNNVALSGFYEDDDPGAGGPTGEAKTMDERPSQASAGGAGPSQNVYRVVAPATVIVRSQRGYGTGVVYDPAGWILTNHHVIAHAQMDSFRMKVSVGIGRLNKQGVMEQQEETFDAYVHKKDALRDMAVIKLVKPPKNLVAIHISDKDPAPGQAVTSIGHAGIGLLWAIKDGQIAAIGKLSKQLAELQLYEATKGTGLSGEVKAKRLKELRKYLESKIPALVIQSTCDISQGDSGGPLVNSRAELVGLNAFVRSSMRARKESNFHIHVAEVRKFIKDVPKRAPQLLPDPWAEGGAVANMGDADLDGQIDTLALYQLMRLGFFQRRMPGAFFLDLDQDSFGGRSKIPEVREVVEKRDFDAELIYLAHGNYLYAWYDTNGDRKPDVLLQADAARKQVEAGYRIGAGGELAQDKSLTEGKLIRPALFTDAAMGARLAAVGGDLFGHHLMPPGSGAARKLPDPIRSAGHKGTLRDLNRDGKPDVVATEGLFSSGFIFDVDQDTLGGFKQGDTLQQVREKGKIDAELSWIALKGGFWAFYDTDNNGSFDLLLHSHRYPMNVVNEGWRIGADGKHMVDKSYLGQYMVQPELLGAQAAAFRAMGSRVLPASKTAAAGGLKVFPDPSAYYGFGYRFKDVKGGKNVAVEVRLSGCSGLLVDVDRDTGRRAKKQKKTLDEMMRLRKFDAEFAQVQCGSDIWTFYDSRGKGYDVVLFSSRGAASKPEVAYLVGKDGKVSPRAKEVACSSLAIPALFKRPADRRAFSKVASELLRNADLKCKP